MSIDLHRVSATLDPDGLDVPVEVTGGNLTMDAGWSPFTQGEIVVPMGAVPPDVGPMIQTTDTLPVHITCSVDGDPDNTNTWKLHARRGRQDYLADTWTFPVASAEALVMDWGHRSSSIGFNAAMFLEEIVEDVLELTVPGAPSVGIDAADVLIANDLRVWAAGTPAWEYIATICASRSARVPVAMPDGTWWVLRNDVPYTAFGTPPVDLPSPGEALSYVEEWERDGGDSTDYASAVIVEYQGSQPGYTSIAVPGSSPAVSVEVEIKRFGETHAPKPPGAVAYDTTTRMSRNTPETSRNQYAGFVLNRRAYLGWHVTWRAVSHYALEARHSLQNQPSLFVDRVTHDFATHEMTVSARRYTSA